MPPRSFLFLSALLFGFAAAGCSPQIGDKCALNTDCSISGTRQCDTSLPGGYCTVFNCGPNSCPDQSACYLFHAEIPGCPYDDRLPSRTAHSFCMKDCSQNSDCRSGYECHDLRDPPWNAILLDDNQDQPACVPVPDGALDNAGDLLSGPDAAVLPVCQADPAIDAAFPPLPDAGVVPPAEDGGTGEDGAAPLDGGFDATLDAGIDATTLIDASDASSVDASDAGAPDASAD